MRLEPPRGSRISVTTDGAYPLILVPHGSGGLMRYFLGLFVLAWLGGWLVGFVSVVRTLSSGGPPSGAYAFLVFWLAAWTVAGVWAVYLAHQAFRPSVPESLKLMPNGVTYDSGVPPLQMYFGYTSHKAWKLIQKGRAWSLIGRNFSRCF